MSIFPFILLICGIGILVAGRSRGGPTLITGGIIVLFAIGSFLFSGGSESDQEMAASVKRGEARGIVVGTYLAQQHPGARVLVLRAPDSYPGPQHPDMVEGLQEGCGDALTIVDILPLPVSPGLAEKLADPEQNGLDRLDLEAWIRLDEIETLVEQYKGQIDLVVLALNHPERLARSAWMRDPDAPKAVLLHYNLDGLGPTIEDGRICVAVAIPSSAAGDRSIGSGLRGNADTVFNKHYVLVTPENVGSMKGELRHLF